MTFNSFLKQPVEPVTVFTSRAVLLLYNPWAGCPILCQLWSEGTQFEHGLQRVALLLGRLWNRKLWSLSEEVSHWG